MQDDQKSLLKNFGSDEFNSLEVYCNIYRDTFLIHVCRAQTIASVLHLTFKAMKDHKSLYLKNHFQTTLQN